MIREPKNARQLHAILPILLLAILTWPVTLVSSGLGKPIDERVSAAGTLPHRLYLPMQTKVVGNPCQPIPGVQYSAIPVDVASPDAAAAEDHPDINLALRGYTVNSVAHKGLVEYGGDTDTNAPQLTNLFAEQQLPEFVSVYQVGQWDGRWPGVYGQEPIADPEVTLLGLGSAAAQVVHLPDRTPDIYQGQYVAMVLYATPDRMTIKYTRDDSVISGYTVHLEGICVEPSLLALYDQLDAAGRGHLPGLSRGQPVGRATGARVGVAIRDTGAFMDPRSRKDWWMSVSAQDTSFMDATGSPWFQARQQAIQERMSLNGH